MICSVEANLSVDLLLLAMSSFASTFSAHLMPNSAQVCRYELLCLWGNRSADLGAVSEAGWGELQLWALVSSEKLIKSETTAGGKIGGGGSCGTERETEHERRHEKEREKEPVGVGLLEDQDYYCCDHCLIFPPLLPLLLVFLIPSACPSSFPVRFFFFLLVASSLFCPTRLLLSTVSPSCFRLSFWPSHWRQAACRRALWRRESKWEPNEMSFASV